MQETSMQPEPMVGPELDALLREVAADSNAGLLLIEPRLAVRAALEDDAHVHRFATGLTSAERELVTVHREELAHLLRQACVMRLFAHPKAKTYTIRQITRELRHEPLELADFRARAERELALARNAPLERDLLRVVEDCVTGTLDGTASIAQLAAASMRLHPSAQARIYVGQELALEDRDREACPVFEAVLERTPRADHAVAAWNSLGTAWCDLDHRERALDAYRVACRLDPSQLMPIFSCFRAAVICGDLNCAHEMASEIDGRMSASDPAVIEYVAMQRGVAKPCRFDTLRERGPLEPLIARLGQTSLRILDELR
jgi:tetratricopeptide (TPR) repeat protein